MKISAKMYGSFAIILVILVAVVVFAPIQMSSLSSNLDNLRSKHIAKLQILTDIKENQNIIARAIRNALLTNDEKIREEEFARVLNSRKKLGQLVQKLSKMAETEKEKQIAKDIAELRQKYIEGQETLIKYARENNKVEAEKFLFGEFREIQGNYFGLVAEQNNLLLNEIDLMVDSSHSMVSSSRNLMIIIGIIGVVLGIVFASVVTSSVSKPVNKAVEASGKVARGNFNIDLETKSKDETALLMAAMKKMVGTIAEMVNDVKKLTEAAINGRLDYRIDSSKYEGEFKALIDGVNGTLDAVIGPYRREICRRRLQMNTRVISMK